MEACPSFVLQLDTSNTYNKSLVANCMLIARSLPYFAMHTMLDAMLDDQDETNTRLQMAQEMKPLGCGRK